MRRFAQIAAVMPLALLLAGCDEVVRGNSNRYREDFHVTQPLKPGGELTVENQNGSIEIVSWDRDEVDISGTKYANSESNLSAVRVDVSNSVSGVRIRTVGPSGSGSWGNWGGWGAKYIISVPRRVNLDRITSSNGSIKVESIEGPARLRTSNGSVRVRDIRGDIEIATSNGGIEIADHNGAVIAHTSNGGIRADEVQGQFHATTSNASINATLRDPKPGKPVRVETSNGSVNLTLEQVRDNDISVSTSNASVTLNLPAELKALLKAHTSHSSITSDFDVNVRSGEISKSHLEGAINGGTSPRIELTTSNGHIKILRAQR